MADLLEYFVVYATVGISVALVYKASRTFQLMMAISAAGGVLAVATTSAPLHALVVIGGATVLAIGTGTVMAGVFPWLRSLPAVVKDPEGIATVEIATFVISSSLLNMLTSNAALDSSLTLSAAKWLTTALMATMVIALALFTIRVRSSRFAIGLELQFADPEFAASMGIKRNRVCRSCFLIAYPMFFLGCVLFALPDSTQVRLQALLELYVMGLALGAFVRFQLHRLWIPALAVAGFQVFGLTYLRHIIPSTATPIVIFAVLMLFSAGTRVRAHTLI